MTVLLLKSVYKLFSVQYFRSAKIQIHFLPVNANINDIFVWNTVSNSQK